MKAIVILLAVLVVYPACMPAQTKSRSTSERRPSVALVDPRIPGIEVIGSDDPRFQSIPEVRDLKIDSSKGEYVAIRNVSDKRVISISVTYLTDSYAYTLAFNGLTVTFDGLGKNESAISTITSLRAANLAVDSGISVSEDSRFTVRSVLFSDGTFYGPENEADKLVSDIKFRKKFLEEARDAPDLKVFMEDWGKCLKDRDCVMARGISPSDWGARDEALGDYKAISSLSAEAGRDLVNRHILLAAKHPQVKRVASHRNPMLYYADEKANLKPDDALDGWYISFIVGTCWNGNLGFSPTIRNGCTYPIIPNNVAPDSIFGALNQPTTLGIHYRMSGYCLKMPTGPPPQIFRESLLHEEDTINLKQQPSAGLYLPRERTFIEFSTNYAQNGDWADLSRVGVINGVTEPFYPTSNADGGETVCMAQWFLPQSLPGSFIPVYSDVLNPANTFADGYYGYMVLNRKNTYACYDGNTPGVPVMYTAPYDATRPRPVRASPVPGTKMSAVVSCLHTVTMASGGGDPPAVCTDPLTSCCCCIALYGDPEGICNIPCGGYGQLSCGAAGGFTSGNTTVTSEVSRANSPNGFSDAIVIYRSNNQFLLDAPGINQYISGQSTLIAGFAPPGGRLFTDIPVTGDWSGSGGACIGLYRPTTGHWYLDANCNGVWDASIDRDYSFGGVQPVGSPGQPGYVPGDVPVVGNWTNWFGDNRSCVGIFRQGFAWLIDVDCNGSWDGGSIDNYFTFGGVAGDMPVVGHWFPAPGTNPVLDQVGVVRCYAPSGSCQSYPFFWVLDGTYAFDHFQSDHVPGTGGIPTAGESPGQCAQYYDAVCLTPAPFVYGGYGPSNQSDWASATWRDMFVTGDWLGTGVSMPGLYRQGAWIEDQDFSHTGNTYYGFGGLDGDKPLVGKW